MKRTTYSLVFASTYYLDVVLVAAAAKQMCLNVWVSYIEPNISSLKYSETGLQLSYTLFTKHIATECIHISTTSHKYTLDSYAHTVMKLLFLQILRLYMKYFSGKNHYNNKI